MKHLAWLVKEPASELVCMFPLLSMAELDWLIRENGVCLAGEPSVENERRKALVAERMSRVSKVA